MNKPLDKISSDAPSFLHDRRVHLCIVAVVAICSFANILFNGFVIDDHVFVEQWKTIQSVDVLAAFRGDLPQEHGGVYRPIRTLLYMLYYQFWGISPAGFHAHGIAVITLASVLVYLVIEQLRVWKDVEKNALFALAVAALFAAHPIHTESISYLAASMEMTGTLFFLSAFYVYLRHKTMKEVWASAGIFALGLLTYEMTATLPFLIIWTDVTLRRWQGIKTYIPYWLIAGIYFLVRVFGFAITIRGNYLGYSLYYTQLAMAKVYIKYLWLLLNPLQISYIHLLETNFESFMTQYSRIESILTQSLFDWDVLGAVGILIGLGVTAWKLRKKLPLITWSIGWFFITLLPSAYIFPQGIALAEKYLFLSSIGFLTALAYGVFLVTKKYPQAGMVFLVTLTVIYAGITFRRNGDWRNEVVFWQRVVEQHPVSAFGHYTLGVHLLKAGNVQQAMQHFSSAVAYEPKMVEAYFNLASIYEKNLHDKNQALDMYEKILEIDPQFKPAQDKMLELVKQKKPAQPTQ